MAFRSIVEAVCFRRRACRLIDCCTAAPARRRVCRHLTRQAPPPRRTRLRLSLSRVLNEGRAALMFLMPSTDCDRWACANFFCRGRRQFDGAGGVRTLMSPLLWACNFCRRRPSRADVVHARLALEIARFFSRQDVWHNPGDFDFDFESSGGVTHLCDTAAFAEMHVR